jgi:hypothetical protein
MAKDLPPVGMSAQEYKAKYAKDEPKPGFYKRLGAKHLRG